MAMTFLNEYSLDDEHGDIIDSVDNTYSAFPELTFDVIAGYFHKQLFSEESVTIFLTNLGLYDPTLLTRFTIGYDAGNLVTKVSKKQVEYLKQLGLLPDGDTSYFKGCLTVGLYDDAGQTTGIAGIKGESAEAAKPIFQPGKQGIFNPKASTVYADELILTESLVDALAFIRAGFDNVQAFSDPTSFIGYHFEKLKADRVKRVVLALPGDERGTEAGEILTKLFLDNNIDVKNLSPPKPHTAWYEALHPDTELQDQVRNLIKQAETIKAKQDDVAFAVRTEGIKRIYTVDGVTYRIQGVKDMFVSSLRVNVRAEFAGEMHIDNIDLYSARSRRSFSAELAGRFDLEAKKIEKDLVRILEHLEAERDRQFETSADEKPYEMDEAERMAGMAFLQSPDLFKTIVNDLSTLGYVGEDLNKLLVYLAASSRKLNDPIHVLIVSQSASGKSMLVDTVKKLIPPEDVLTIMTLSDQALHYLGDVMHKFMVFGESMHSETIEHLIREMLSSKELTRLVTDKDEKTGKMQSSIKQAKMHVSSVMSTTNNNINPENASRYFMINTDESKDQTRRIHDAQRSKYSLDRYLEKRDRIPAIIQTHQAAQRLLQNYVIINPFAHLLDFPDATMRTRRDNDRFLDLIACVAFLRQYQKEIKRKNGIEYIECDLTDYQIAYDIMIGAVLSSTLSDLPTQAVTLYDEIRTMVQELAAEKDVKPDEVSFTQRDVREYTGSNQSQVKKYIKLLVDFEYINLIRGGGERRRAFYRLIEDEPIQVLSLAMIPKPEDIEKKGSSTE